MAASFIAKGFDLLLHAIRSGARFGEVEFVMGAKAF